MNVFKKIAAGSLLLALGSTATAAVVYDESVSGDIGSLASGLVLNLGVGDNQVMGSFSVGKVDRDSDNFTFLLPSQSQLVAVTYSFYNLVREGVIHNVHIGARLDDTSYHVLSPVDDITIMDWNVAASPVSLFVGSLPLLDDAIVWRISTTQFSGTVNTPDQAYWDYTINFQVADIGGGSSVPEPAWR